MSNTEKRENIEKIKHLVISSCGPNIIALYGVLKELCNNDIVNLDNIESFHCASGGAILSVIVLLKNSWQEVDDYIVDRPWEKVLKFDMESFIGGIDQKGIFNIDDFFQILEPFFASNDLTRDSTLHDFYLKTQKEINIYISELNHFEWSVLNYKTHPTMQLLEALYISSAVPIIFAPIIKTDCDDLVCDSINNNNVDNVTSPKCYLDGGLFNYFPCFHIDHLDTSTVLGICNDRSRKKGYKINHSSNLIDYIFCLIKKTINHTINQSFHESKLIHKILVPGFDSNSLWISLVYEKEKRKEMIALGEKTALEYIQNSYQ